MGEAPYHLHPGRRWGVFRQCQLAVGLPALPGQNLVFRPEGRQVGLSLQQLGWEVEARGMRFHGAAEKAFFMRFEQDLPMIKVL
ncbi:MAG: hypothetical protein EBT34_06885 [Acetobacteraceae bacterium]|jgi:hypothetical protein|nr:hypothetical protein [Acetobacteraceae bacterium]